MKNINKPGFEHYLINEKGEIFTTITTKYKKLETPIIKKSYPNKNNGYIQIILTNTPKGYKPKCFYVHRLVAEHFIPNPNNYNEVNHKNKIRNDNRVENLEWCTKKQNNEHKFSDFVHKINKIELNINENLLQEGISLYKKNHNSIEISKLWNCNSNEVIQILKKYNIEIKKYGFKCGPNKNKPANIYKSYIPKYWFLTDDGYNFSI